MRTNISIWLKHKGEEDCITTIYDSNHIPFKVGDKFWFSVEEMHPRRMDNLRKEGWKEEFVVGMAKSYLDMQKKYHNRKFKIVKIYRSLQVDSNSNDDHNHHRLSIEYTVKEVKTIYWKFWQTYNFKQFVKRIFKPKS